MKKYLYAAMILFAVSTAISAEPPAPKIDRASLRDHVFYRKLTWDAESKKVSGAMAVYFSKLDEVYIMEFSGISLTDSITYFWEKTDSKIILKVYEDMPLSFPNLFSWIDAINHRYKADKMDFSPISAIGRISLNKKDGEYWVFLEFYRAEDYRYELAISSTLHSGTDEDFASIAGWQYAAGESEIKEYPFPEKPPRASIENTKIIHKKQPAVNLKK